MTTTPILMLGAGRMGGAMIEGWLAAQAFSASDLIIRDPEPSAAARAAVDAGAVLNPPDSELARARTVVLAVKPQVWKGAAAEFDAWLHPDAVIVSIAAGVGLKDISKAFGKRPTARVMPTTAASINQTTASVYADDPAALARAHALFDPLGTVVDLTDEGQLHAATAVSGSAPAYLYAFIEALEAAGSSAGLKPEDAQRLARATITGAAALLAKSGADPGELRRQVTSPGGTTQAALEVLLAPTAFPDLLRHAVQACVRRSKELAG